MSIFTSIPTGFMDYRNSFPETKQAWTIIGTIFYIIGFIAYLPETFELVTSKTNYGLSLLFTFGNSIGQWLLVINFLCLNYDEFLGFFTNDFKTCYPALLVFIELFTQWFLFLPCVYLTLHLDDREHISELPKNKRLLHKIECIGLVILNVIVSLGLLLAWAIIGTRYGFNSPIIEWIGEACGVLSTLLEVLQYVPQFYTTIKIRDNGSLSLLMLEIQGPTALANGIYMAVALGESWTTYSCSLVDASAQLSLLGICLCFKFCKKIKSDNIDYPELSVKVLEAYEKAAI